MERDPLLGRQNDDAGREGKKHKLGVISGVYVPVFLSIISILMFLRFGVILGQIGLVGMLGLLVAAYLVNFVTVLSLSAVASNGEVKGGGAYYLISRSLGPEFGGSIGLLFYLSQVLNAALNVVGFIDCLDLSFGSGLPHGYWWGYLSQTAVLAACTLLCLAGSSLFAKASNGLLAILVLATLSIPFSALFQAPFVDHEHGIEFTGPRLSTLWSNFLPRHAEGGHGLRGLAKFRDLFGILFPATSGIFAGASMSGDLRNPSKSIPVGTLWAMLSTFILYFVVILSIAASTTHASLLSEPNIIQMTNLWAPIVLAGECAVCLFSALMGLIASAKIMQALGRDKLLPGLSAFAWGTQKTGEPLLALLLTYVLAQLALFADLNQIATLISMGYMVTFFVMNLACFLLKIGSAPNFRPAFQFFSWQSALLGSILSAVAMFFVDETYGTSSVVLLFLLFLLIHYFSPPKHWGDVSQNLIYHQVRKYLLRLKPEHIKFWRPQIILLINNPRRQTRLIQFCNSIKKGSLYILGHAIVSDDFNTGVHEAKLQHVMWSKYITEYSRIKAFVQLTMSPSLTWGVRNLILSSGLGGMRPNIAVLGFYNMDELRASSCPSAIPIPNLPPQTQASSSKDMNLSPTLKKLRRRDTTAKILEGALPTDVIKTEGMTRVTDYFTILEDLAFRHRINVAVAKGFQSLDMPGSNHHGSGQDGERYIDLWPIQMSAELEADGKNILTTNFDTYTLILQLGYILHTVPAWKNTHKLRVMVFVEYENEVEEERGRVEALLDKLRISASVHVFWLASGDLATYEVIINGRYPDPSVEHLVNEALKDDPWWVDIGSIRGKAFPMSPSGTSTRTAASNQKRKVSIRRPSMTDIEDLQKYQTVSALARLGLSMGIRTHNLAPKFQSHNGYSDNFASPSSASNDTFDDDDESSDPGDYDPDFNDVESTASEADLDMSGSAVLEPLLSAPPQARRKSDGDASPRRPTFRRKKTDENKRSQFVANTTPATPPPVTPPPVTPTPRRDYGTMSAALLSVERLSRPTSPTREQRPPTPSIRFSSNLTPMTRITSPEESERTIMFADTDIFTPSRPERPPLSRASSRQSRVSLAESFTKKKSKTMPIETTTEGSSRRPSVKFEDPARDQQQQPRPPYRPQFLRHSSTPIMQLKDYKSLAGESSSTGGNRQGNPQIIEDDREAMDEARLSMVDLLDEYRSRQREGGEGPQRGRNADRNSVGTSSGSSYATQDLALSFNNLPRRAQHLILNELMRKQSSNDGANYSTDSTDSKKKAVRSSADVLFTTLPIPDEGTCRSEAASIQYLADVELLCQDLPPVLMILSNNMTVTVSL